MTSILQIVWNPKTGKYFIVRKDDPRHRYHEITLGAVIDASKQFQRYEQDWVNEHG